MRSSFVSLLGSVQALLLIGKGICVLMHRLTGVEDPFGWTYVLIPLWILLGIAVVFWGFLGLIIAKLR